MRKYKSTTHYVIASLIPYTEPNLKLVFKPTEYFKEISKINKSSESAVRSAYYRAIKQNLVSIDENGDVRLTPKGRRYILPYVSKKLENAQIMVIFDIPEIDRWKRSKLRLLLKEFSFVQVQKSVWVTSLDCREFVKAGIEELNFMEEVKIYECRPL